jgi:hypothetical protein
MLKVSLADAKSLLKECGYPGTEVDTYSPARSQKKLEGLPKHVDDDNAPESKAGKKLFKQIVEEMKNDGKITVEGGEEEEKVEKTTKKEEKVEKSTKKAPKAEEPEEDDEEVEEDDEEEAEEDEESDDEEEDEDEEEEEAPKKSGKKGPKKGTRPPASAGGEGKPGIIASIVEFLQGATEAKPITKEKILTKLEKRFPDRSADAMKKTVNVQVPNRIVNDKKLTVHKDKDGKGYWINPDDEKKAAPKSDKKAAKAAKAKAKSDEDDEEDDD